ncbi:MAG: hypothetical protein Kow0098_03360 [Ignavibacteriaceae bacterium]
MNTATLSLLPVDSNGTEGYTDEDTFNPGLHKSHLLSCPGRRQDWNNLKRKFKELDRKEFRLSQKDY